MAKRYDMRKLTVDKRAAILDKARAYNEAAEKASEAFDALLDEVGRDTEFGSHLSLDGRYAGALDLYDFEDSLDVGWPQPAAEIPTEYQPIFAALAEEFPEFDVSGNVDVRGFDGSIAAVHVHMESKADDPRRGFGDFTLDQFLLPAEIMRRLPVIAEMIREKSKRHASLSLALLHISPSEASSASASLKSQADTNTTGD